MQTTLVRHSGTEPEIGLTVHHERQGDRLWVRFVVEGDVDAIAWPASTDEGRADRLWKHSCFEVFVATADGYREFNLSPSGQWAAYRFDGYRRGMSEAAEVARIVKRDMASDMVALEASIDLPASVTALGLSAVIEARDGAKSYWALTHPGEAPDFHHPASFALDLTEPA